MLEFDVDGKKYKITDGLDAFKQSHIVRRLAPAIGGLAPLVKDMRSFKGDPLTAIANAVGPITEALAKLSDEDVEYIQKNCLAVVFREQGEGKWARVFAHGGVVQFNDIGLLEMNEIVIKVLKHHLSDFFSGLARRGWTGPQSE